MTRQSPIQAAIFDMDGLLVDSEPLWTQAEIEVFATVGIDLDERTCRQTVGMGLDDVVEFRYAQKPWTGPSRQDISHRIYSRVRELISQKARARPGARETLDMMLSKNIKIGLATASDMELVKTVQKRLSLEGLFHSIRSASELQHSKPHPQVYLEVARELCVAAQRCLAFEDSVVGIIAAKAARMLAVAVPAPDAFDDPRFGISDIKIRTLDDFDEITWQRLLKIATQTRTK